MKPSTVLLCSLALAIVVCARFFLGRPRPLGDPAATTAAPPAPPSAAMESPVATRASECPIVADAPPASTPAGALPSSLHLKLRELQQITTGDTGTPARLLAELAALLTDDNTVNIVHALSAAEFATPFGAVALGRWLRLDPAAAATWIAARPDATDEHALLVARQLASDPADCAAFCDPLPASLWKEKLLDQTGRQLLSAHPAAAIALAERMAPGASRNDLLQTVAYDWMTRDLSAATTWIVGLDDPALREQLLAVGAKAIAATDPDLASTWLGEAVKSDDLRNETALSIAETWAARSPAAAARWVAGFPNQAARTTAIDLVLDQWVRTEPGPAIAWAARLPDRDRLIANWTAAERERMHPAPDPQ